jgi:chemotaxis signal transduction protein
MSADLSRDLSGSRDRREGGGAGGGGQHRLHRDIGAFWLSEHCYGLDIGLVGEVVEIESLAPVPLAPASVRGLFNLRGTPVSLVDPTKMLNLPEPPMNDEPRPGHPLTALVLRTETILIGLLIRRMEMVITRGKGIFSAAEATDAEHPAVVGFLELGERGGLTVTVLHTDAVIEHIDRLKYAHEAAV